MIRRRVSDMEWFTVVIVGIITVLLLVGGCVYLKYVKESTVTFTITDKTGSGGGHNGHKYLIFTDKGTFEDTDNLFHTKFASSDLYAQLHIGHTYRCKVTGWRVPLFSSYKDLISCSEVK